MQTLWVRKGEAEPVLINAPDIQVWVGKGYKECAAPPSRSQGRIGLVERRSGPNAVWVQKDSNEPLLVNTSDLDSWTERGYVECQPKDEVREPLRSKDANDGPGQGLIRLVRDGNECLCSEVNLAVFEAQGWVRPDQTGGSTDGGEQHEGRKLDQESGNGEDGQGSGDNAERVEQPASSGGDEPAGRKRRNVVQS